MASYRAIAERNHTGWRVTIDGLAPPVHFSTRDLADVEPRALKMLWGYTGEDLDGLAVEVKLPDTIEQRLDVIAQLCDERDAGVDSVVNDLLDLGVPVADVESLLGRRYRPSRPFIVTNRELLAYGLDRHPEALGVRWDDHGFAVTMKCRDHVEATRRSYRTAPPDEVNALIYPGSHFVCDLCDEGDQP